MSQTDRHMLAGPRGCRKGEIRFARWSLYICRNNKWRWLLGCNLGPICSSDAMLSTVCAKKESNALLTQLLAYIPEKRAAILIVTSSAIHNTTYHARRLHARLSKTTYEWVSRGRLWIVERVLELPDAAIMGPVSADGYSVDQRTLARHQEDQDSLLPRLDAWT